MSTSQQADAVDLQSAESAEDLDEEAEEFLEEGGGHDGVDDDGHYELSDNVARDLIKYIRSNTVKNEQQFLLIVLGYLSGYFEEPDHFVSGVIIGTSSGGKTHVQKQVEKLFPDGDMYRATTGSDKALVYDGAWEECEIASLDELNKPSETMIEFLKSVHGDDEDFEYKVTGEGEGADRGTETIVRSSKPYWFLFAQTGADFEMWNRLLKIPVHESESKNRAVGAFSFDHHHISIGGDVEYGYDFDGGKKALQYHIQTIQENTPGRVFLPNGQGDFGWDVWEIVEPIFNHSRSESNRVYDMVSNLIRASALLNYKDREVRTIAAPGKEPKDYIVADPQDVANVLACRESLLASTHELDRKRRGICEAIREKSGYENEAEVDKIREGIVESEMSQLSRAQLNTQLEVLRDNYLVRVNEGAGSKNRDTYQFMGFDSMGFAKVPENDGLFAGTNDPISGDPFLESHDELRGELDMDAQQLMSDSSPEVSSNKDASGGDGDTSTSLGSFGGGTSRSIDLEPHVEVVRQYAQEAIDGERIGDLSDVPVEALLGITSLEDPDRGVDTTGTPLDHEHDMWSQKGKPSDWVSNERNAREEVKNAFRVLLEKRVIIHEEVHEQSADGKPIDVTMSVLDQTDL